MTAPASAAPNSSEHVLGHVLQQHADVLARLHTSRRAPRDSATTSRHVHDWSSNSRPMLSSSARASSASAIDLSHAASPSTRSAMMLRWISDAPAEIVLAKEWKYCSSQLPCGSSTLCVPSATIVADLDRRRCPRSSGADERHRSGATRWRTTSSTPAPARRRRAPTWRSRDTRDSAPPPCRSGRARRASAATARSSSLPSAASSARRLFEQLAHRHLDAQHVAEPHHAALVRQRAVGHGPAVVHLADEVRAPARRRRRRTPRSGRDARDG